MRNQKRTVLFREVPDISSRKHAGEEVGDLSKSFMEAIEDSLNFLCESGRQMIFFHLERYNIKKHDIPRKPEAFANCLEDIFGEGASVLEKLILKNLCSKLGLQYEEKPGYSFADYLRKIGVVLAKESK